MVYRRLTKHLPFPGTTSVYRSLCSSLDSGIFVAQYFSTCDQFGNIIVQKLNKDGDSIWSRCYGNPMYSRYSAIGQGIITASDDGFIFVGSANLTPLMTGGGGLTHYVYVVKADSLGNVSSSLNLNNNTNYSEMIVYPNPTSGKLQIEKIGILTSECVFSVYNGTGQQVLNNEYIFKDGRIEIDLAPYGKGLFLVVFSEQGNIFTHKVMVE